MAAMNMPGTTREVQQTHGRKGRPQGGAKIRRPKCGEAERAAPDGSGEAVHCGSSSERWPYVLHDSPLLTTPSNPIESNHESISSPTDMNLQKCMEKCMGNCSCTAYAESAYQEAQQKWSVEYWQQDKWIWLEGMEKVIDDIMVSLAARDGIDWMEYKRQLKKA
ncbi:hypothetical protein K1719_042814 [Acacia pycnantha]|nr:hypothetical protein K1719_042814 [Acacia pycnantha]